MPQHRPESPRTVSCQDLKVWQKGLTLTCEVYRLAAQLPDYERFELSSQMRKAAVSVIANIAEGYGRSQLGDYQRHISIAKGSVTELETLLMITFRTGLLEVQAVEGSLALAGEVGRMLAGLLRRLRRIRSTSP